MPRNNWSLRLFRLDLLETQNRQVYYKQVLNGSQTAYVITDPQDIFLYKEKVSGKKNTDGTIKENLNQKKPKNLSNPQENYPNAFFNTLNALISLGIKFKFKKRGLQLFDTTKQHFFPSDFDEEYFIEDIFVPETSRPTDITNQSDFYTNPLDHSEVNLETSQLFVTGASIILIEICRRLFGIGKKKQKINESSKITNYFAAFVNSNSINLYNLYRVLHFWFFFLNGLCWI